MIESYTAFKTNVFRRKENKVNAFLRKLENLGVLDLVVWSGIIAVAAIAIVGISVPVILEQPQWWGYQPVVVAVRMSPVDFTPELIEVEVSATTEPNLVPEVNEETELPEPVCLNSNVVRWGSTYYVAHPGMHLSNEGVKGWYALFFIDKLGYIPDDIRPLAGVDGSTDSIGSHYIDAWDGQIHIDHIPCK